MDQTHVIPDAQGWTVRQDDQLAVCGLPWEKAVRLASELGGEVTVHESGAGSPLGDQEARRL